MRLRVAGEILLFLIQPHSRQALNLLRQHDDTVQQLEADWHHLLCLLLEILAERQHVSQVLCMKSFSRIEFVSAPTKHGVEIPFPPDRAGCETLQAADQNSDSTHL